MSRVLTAGNLQVTGRQGEKAWVYSSSGQTYIPLESALKTAKELFPELIDSKRKGLLRPASHGHIDVSKQEEAKSETRALHLSMSAFNAFGRSVGSIQRLVDRGTVSLRRRKIWDRVAKLPRYTTAQGVS